jgi:hypothetical protein
MRGRVMAVRPRMGSSHPNTDDLKALDVRALMLLAVNRPYPLPLDLRIPKDGSSNVSTTVSTGTPRFVWYTNENDTFFFFVSYG